LLGQHIIDPRIEHLVVGHTSCIQVLMPLERLEGQGLGAPEKFDFTVQVLDDLDCLSSQRVAWLIGLGEDHQHAALELASQRLGQHAHVVVGADTGQIARIALEGSVGICTVCGQAHKAGVVLDQVHGEPGIGGLDSADPGQP